MNMHNVYVCTGDEHKWEKGIQKKEDEYWFFMLLDVSSFKVFWYLTHTCMEYMNKNSSSLLPFVYSILSWDNYAIQAETRKKNLGKAEWKMKEMSWKRAHFSDVLIKLSFLIFKILNSIWIFKFIFKFFNFHFNFFKILI